MILLLTGKFESRNSRTSKLRLKHELVLAILATISGFVVSLYGSPVLHRYHRQYQSTSYNQPYYNQYQQPTNYQYQQNHDVCDGQDKFLNPLSVYDMGQNILGGLLGPSAGFGGVTVNTSSIKKISFPPYWIHPYWNI